MYNSTDLCEAARTLRRQSGDTQEKAAERIGKDQAQISRAERGVAGHESICIQLIEEYSDFAVEHPLYRLRKGQNEAEDTDE